MSAVHGPSCSKASADMVRGNRTGAVKKPQRERAAQVMHRLAHAAVARMLQAHQWPAAKAAVAAG